MVNGGSVLWENVKLVWTGHYQNILQLEFQGPTGPSVLAPAGSCGALHLVVIAKLWIVFPSIDKVIAEITLLFPSVCKVFSLFMKVFL